MEKDGKNSEKDIRVRYFFGQNQKRSLIVNPLSKLWWIGRLTYDKGRKDPFELTKYLENDFATKYLNVLGGTYILDYFTKEEIEEKVIRYLKGLD